MYNRPSSANSELAILAAGTRLLQAALRVDWSTPPTQALLGLARSRFGSALCACRPQPLKLQIRLREGRFHLAVWPQDGPAHDTECMFFRDELAESASVESSPPALSTVTAPAAAPTAPTSLPQRRQLSLGRPLHQGTGEVQVSVRSLSHKLWESASLCRWHPTWTRDWGRTRYQLLQAASEVAINGAPAEDLIFVPRPYRETQQDLLNAEWESFVRDLVTASDGLPRILIAPVRKLIGDDDGAAAIGLRHLRSPIGLHQACHDFITRECRNVISNSRLLGIPARAQRPGAPPSGPEVIGFFSVEPSSRGGVWARAGWLMAVHPTTYIPAASHNVVHLIDQLVHHGHAFQHLLSERQPTQRTTSDWLLRHVLGPDGQPVARAALEILNKGSGSAFHEARAALADRMRAQGIPTWTWTPTGSRPDRRVPPLPPTDQMAPEAAEETLRQIAMSPVADYQFGPSPKFFSTTDRKSA